VPYHATVPPLRFLGRRAGVFGIALTAYDIYRRVPPQQRRLAIALARKHGPTVAVNALRLTRSFRAPRGPGRSS
jgi:hypothetical protein